MVRDQPDGALPSFSSAEETLEMHAHLTLFQLSPSFEVSNHGNPFSACDDYCAFASAPRRGRGQGRRKRDNTATCISPAGTLRTRSLSAALCNHRSIPPISTCSEPPFVPPRPATESRVSCAMKRSRSPESVPKPVRPAKKVKAETPPVSPFPNFEHPTAEESKEVIILLHSEFPHIQAYRNDHTTEKYLASPCGGVTDVVEALVETILSQNTSAKNSTAAKRNLDATFGRNNFAAIAHAPSSRVVDAIRTGGLANKKATTIQNLLNSIHAKHGSYSLQHLAEKEYSDEDVMEELVSYDGVGPKTASCVLMFCLERESFPVDTHVFRLSKLLGWIPAKSNRISAQAHLDLRIPGELKYGLHVLMIAHGRRCSGCKNRSRGACSLKTYRLGKKGEGIDGDVHGSGISQGPSAEAGDGS